MRFWDSVLGNVCFFGSVVTLFGCTWFPPEAVAILYPIHVFTPQYRPPINSNILIFVCQLIDLLLPVFVVLMGASSPATLALGIGIGLGIWLTWKNEVHGFDNAVLRGSLSILIIFSFASLAIRHGLTMPDTNVYNSITLLFILLFPFVSWKALISEKMYLLSSFGAFAACFFYIVPLGWSGNTILISLLYLNAMSLGSNEGKTKKRNDCEMQAMALQSSRSKR